MKTFTLISVAAVMSMTVAGVVYADTDHGHGATAVATTEDDGMPGRHGDMMQMMMKMHAGMMGGDHQGNMDMMGAADGSKMGMMDQDMMRMMMAGNGMMQAPSAEGFRTMMQSALATYDADSDGALSIAEFKTFHAAVFRETMVDRFQHLDADGDGRITAAEIGTPADRYEMRMMQNAPAPGMMMDGNSTKQGE